MGETVNYSCEMWGFKSQQELEEFRKLANTFQDLEEYDEDSWGSKPINENEPTKKEEWEQNFEFRWYDGWRGGGNSCQDFLKQHFGDFLEARPHIKFKFFAEYLEQTPTELEWERT